MLSQFLVLLGWVFSLERRERTIVNQTNIGTASKATLGKLQRETEHSAYVLFRAHRYCLELNGTELGIFI